MTDRQLDEERLFHVARGIPDEQTRAEYLGQICAADQALRQRVEALLEVHEKEQDFLKSNAEPAPTVDQSPITEAPGQQIGRYKLLQQIGEGGFGVVYMAEQETPVRRKVALKIIKLGMDTKQVIARFEAERQALAMMEHSNIAKVFDAGATESGRPYFVMELVKGISITEYCDQNNLTTQQRLLLFLDVCHAIHHAHQKGIIHRDVKPSNVMVTMHDGRPVPKVIDFGVSKATNQRLTEKTLFTEYHQLIGTPQYMSPEQAEMSGLDIDTRSDLYSLGALLYEVLTGAPPFEAQSLREAGYAEIQRIIREVEPPKPSTRLETLIQESTDVAKHHGAEPHLLPKLIRGDLDWIVMKAMEKDRTRRYESASALAEDIERHLQAEPVLAAPPSAGYKLRKFVKRNKGPVWAAAAMALLLVAGTAVSTWQAVRASRARAEAERQAGISQAVSDFLRHDLLGSADPWSGRAEGASVVSFLDAASKQLQGKFADEPLIEASIRQTLGSTYFHLGRYREAEEHLKRSLEVYRDQLGNEDFYTLYCMRELGGAYRFRGKYEQAEPLLVEALEGMRRTLNEENEVLLVCMEWLAWLYLGQGRYEEAERLSAEGLEVARRKLGDEHWAVPIFMKVLGAMYSQQQRFDEAEKLLTEALDILRRTQGDLGLNTLNTIDKLGSLYSDQQRYEDAERLLVEALEGRRKVLGEEHPDTFSTMGALGTLYRRQGKLDQAEQLLVECYQKSRAALGEEHRDTLSAMSSLGGLYRRQGKFDEAEQLLVECYEKSRETLGEEHPATGGLGLELGILYYRQGKTDELVALLANTVERMRRGVGDENPMTLHGMYGLGMWYLHIGRDVEAEMLLSKALEVRRRVLGEDHPDTQASVGMEYFKRSQYDKAEPLLVKALEDERRMHAGGEIPPLIAIYNLALVHHRLGDYDKAEPLLLELLELSQGVLVEGHPDTVAAMNELIKLYEAWGEPQKAEQWRSKLPPKNGTEEQ